MSTTLTVSAGILKQSIFDKVGVGLSYDTLHFEDGIHTASVPLKMNSGTTITGDDNAIIKLASRSSFPSMTPVLGQKPSKISNIEVSGITFDGNSSNQTVPLGRGFYNFIGLKNGNSISIHDVHLHDSTGDMARLTNVKNVRYYKNKVIRCGHDGLYVDGGENIEACDNYTELRTNSAVRLRHVKKGRVLRNIVKNKVGGAASSPGFQFETSTSGMYSSDILVEGNEVSDTWGPVVWAVCTTNPKRGAAIGITFRNNTFINCGNMDGGYHHIPGVGGLVIDCWDNVLVENNNFKDCRGYGVLFGDYIKAGDVGYNLTAIVRNNRFTGTRKSNTVGTASGSAIANLKPDRYTVTAYGNSYSGNVRNLYNVVEKPGTVQDPVKPTVLKIQCYESQIPAVIDICKDKTILKRKL